MKIFTTRSFSVVAKVVLAIVACWVTAFFFTTLFQSWPISQNWTGQGYQLLNDLEMYLALGVTDVLTDVAILALPIPMIYRLHTNKAKKLFVLGIFSLSFL